MEFLIPNYRCLQNPWPGGCRTPDPRSVLCPQLNLLNPPRKKFLGTPLADGGIGVAGIHWSAELRVSQGLSSTRRFDYCCKCLDSHSSLSKVYRCNVTDLAHRETVLSPLLIGVARFQTRCHPQSHRWHELEFLCHSVYSAALGPTQPPVQWVPGSFLGGKAAGAWRWPHTPSIVEVKKGTELYLYSPLGLHVILQD